MSRRDNFEGADLDRSVWLPHYLPMWSSMAETTATYAITDEGLRLWIEPDAPLWCPDVHEEPLRVSAIQSGNRSGPVGSTDGQQRIDDVHTVQEAQTRFEGWLPVSGTMSIHCRMDVSPRAMAAMWLSGVEDRPEDSGELCVVEVFGRSVDRAGAEVGVGVKSLDDPRLRQDFVDPRLPIDVGEFHTYSVTWGDGRSVFSVDGDTVHRSPQAPIYPMQVMIAVFDFPAWTTGSDEDHVPELVVDWVAHTH
jgi:hypothetical protein